MAPYPFFFFYYLKLLITNNLPFIGHPPPSLMLQPAGIIAPFTSYLAGVPRPEFG
jgi:hypothetical protein